jgi:hypothetical protein
MFKLYQHFKNIYHLTPTLYKDLLLIKILNHLKHAEEVAVIPRRIVFWCNNVGRYLLCLLLYFTGVLKHCKSTVITYFKGCFICVMTCDMSLTKFYVGFMQLNAFCLTIIYSKQLDVCILISQYLDFWYSSTKSIQKFSTFLSHQMYCITRDRKYIKANDLALMMSCFSSLLSVIKGYGNYVTALHCSALHYTALHKL